MNIHTDHHAFTSTSIKVTHTPTQSSVRPMLVRFARTLATAALTVVLAACGSSSDVATPALSAPSLADISSRTLAKDALAEALVFTNTGGAPQAGAGGCTATGLPAGLVVGPTANGNSCMITGTPITANQNAVTVTVTAVNTAGNSVATVVLTVSDGQPIVDATSPVIANIVVEQTYVSGAVIAPITFTNTGLAVKATDGCIVSPALPASLGVAVFTDNGKMTCQITGTPAATAARKTYIVTATSDNNGTNTASVSIEIVQTSPSLYTQVAVGASNACAINTVGELYCWGRGDSGRLGLGDTNDRAAPTRVGTATNWSQVNTSNHTCAINTARELYCWGKGDIGQLGLGDTNDRNTPTRVGTATNWSQVNAGNRHTCAINTANELYCWGNGDIGQLGLQGDTDGRTAPARIDTNPRLNTNSNWSTVSAGSTHTCGITIDGRILCWGDGSRGQLGLSNSTNSTGPFLIGVSTSWSQVYATSSHTCATTTGDVLLCWGWNVASQLGLGDTNNRNAPTRVGSTISWSQIGGGFSHTCAINTAGELYCWGSNTLSQLGLGDDTNNRTTPTRVGTVTNWSQISAGDAHTCAINTAKELYCWGADLLAGTNNINAPTRVVIAAN